MKINIFDYWYQCPLCLKEKSVSQSVPLEYAEYIKCSCGASLEIKGLEDVQVKVLHYEDVERRK